MEVYIEYVILDNLIINYLLMNTTLKICNKKVNKTKIIFADLLAAILTIIMPLISNNNLIQLVYKLIVGLIIIVCIYKYNNIKEYFITYLIFLTVTMLFGGLIIATLSVFDIQYSTSGLLFLSFEIPISSIVLVVYFYYKIFAAIYKYLAAKNKVSNYYYESIILNNGKKYTILGYLDTGNCLYDIDNNPIVVVDKKTFCDIFRNFPYHKLILKKVDNNDIRDGHYIDIGTVSSKDKMLVFKIDNLIIKQDNNCRCYSDVSVGLSNTNFKNYDMILHNGYCK